MAEVLEMNDKAVAYADALIVSITDTAERLGGPDINAALAALVHAQAYLLAKLPSAVDRLAGMKACNNSLAMQTSAFVLENVLKGSKANPMTEIGGLVR